MLTRFIIFCLIAVLALPVVTVTPPAETSSSPWGDVAVAAKGQKHKRHKKRKPCAPRQTVTQTFYNPQPLLIPNGAPGATDGPANHYPTTIAVNGLRHGVVTDVNLVLTGLTHGYPEDVDILLSKGDAHRALVLSDVGDDNQIANVNLTLDDEAAAEMSDSRLTSGAYRPTNLAHADDGFALPAPDPDRNVALSTFDGLDPNGAWSLWVMDNSTGDSGIITGWALEITAEVDAAKGQNQASVSMDAQNKKCRGRQGR
jgi:hypothetical protein